MSLLILFENFKGNDKQLNYIIKSLSFNLFKGIIDRGYDIDSNSKQLTDYTLKEKKTCYQRIISYCEGILKQDYKLETKYMLNPCGRAYAKSPMNLQVLPNEIRGFLCKNIMTDIDIKNSQPTIIRWICQQNNILCPYLDMYVKDRSEILKSNNLDKITMIISMNSNKRNKKITNDFFIGFDTEMKTIQLRLLEKFKDIEYYNIIKSNIDADTAKRNYEGAFLNRVYFNSETKIILHLIKLLREQNIDVNSYNYDGVMVKGDYYQNTGLLEFFNKSIREKFELDELFELTYKPHNDTMEIPDDYVEPEEKPDCYELFKKLSVEFEKTHCKVINNGCYIKDADDTVLLWGRDSIHKAYEHMSCGYDSKGKLQSFIDMWLVKNDKIRRYEKANIYPKEELCPDSTYNLWKPWRVLKTPSRLDINAEIKPLPSEEVEMLLNHFKILCNNNEEHSEYLVKWVAQMFQYPEQKSVCIVLISKEGAGKGTLLKMLRRLMGDGKVFETSNPLRDIFDGFNGQMTNAFLVNLNEVGKKDMVGAKGKLKNLITDPKLTINEKNEKKIEIDSYHRFLITSNEEEPINTSKDTRRDVIIRCSDELLGNAKYFDTINAFIDDDLVMRDFYDTLMTIKGLEDFRKIPLPKTEYQQNMTELNISVIEQWVSYWTFEHFNDKVRCKEMTSKEMYDEFMEWKNENNIKNYEVDVIKFGVRISNSKIEGIESFRGSGGIRKKRFNIDTLINFFNITIEQTTEQTIEQTIEQTTEQTTDINEFDSVDIIEPNEQQSKKKLKKLKCIGCKQNITKCECTNLKLISGHY